MLPDMAKGMHVAVLCLKGNRIDLPPEAELEAVRHMRAAWSCCLRLNQWEFQAPSVKVENPH